MKKGAMQELLRRPIAYHPIIAKAFGSVQAAVFWSQLYYWSDKTEDKAGWIYKTSTDIFKETGLKRRGQETARATGVKLGVIHEDRRGMPAKMHFRVDMEKTIEVIEAYTQQKKSGKKEGSKPKVTENDGGLLNKLMELFQIVNPSYERLYAQTTQRKALDRMMTKMGYQQVEAIINFLPIANGSKYSGITIITPYQLERDLGKLKAWGDKQKQNARAKEIMV